MAGISIKLTGNCVIKLCNTCINICLAFARCIKNSIRTTLSVIIFTKASNLSSIYLKFNILKLKDRSSV